MLSRGIQFFNSSILMRHMIQKLGFLQPQVMRDTTVHIFFMAQGQRSSYFMEWQMNQMEQMHHLIVSVSKLSHYQSQDTIQKRCLVLFGITICGGSGKTTGPLNCTTHIRIQKRARLWEYTNKNWQGL